MEVFYENPDEKSVESQIRSLEKTLCAFIFLASKKMTNNYDLEQLCVSFSKQNSTVDAHLKKGITDYKLNELKKKTSKVFNVPLNIMDSP